MLEPTVIGSWFKDGELGSGGFGVVSLWTNHSTKEYLGKQFLIILPRL